MSQKFLDICPNCRKDIQIELRQYFWRKLSPISFDFECPYCSAGIVVQVEAEPIFLYTTFQPTRAADLPKAARVEPDPLGMDIADPTPDSP